MSEQRYGLNIRENFFLPERDQLIVVGGESVLRHVEERAKAVGHAGVNALVPPESQFFLMHEELLHVAKHRRLKRAGKTPDVIRVSVGEQNRVDLERIDRKSTRLNSSH